MPHLAVNINARREGYGLEHGRGGSRKASWVMAYTMHYALHHFRLLESQVGIFQCYILYWDKPNKHCNGSTVILKSVARGENLNSWPSAILITKAPGHLCANSVSYSLSHLQTLFCLLGKANQQKDSHLQAVSSFWKWATMCREALVGATRQCVCVCVCVCVGMCAHTRVRAYYLHMLMESSLMSTKKKKRY